MVDLGRPDHFAAAEGVVEVIEVTPQFTSGVVASAGWEIFETPPAEWLWRLRYASFTGTASGTVGAITWELGGFISFEVGPPWPSSGPLVAVSPVDVQHGEDFSLTWNTEIADNYAGVGVNFGRTVVLGLPLLYLPKLTSFQLNGRGIGGYDGDYQIHGGVLQIERFQADRVTGGNASAADLYLLPAAG